MKINNSISFGFRYECNLCEWINDFLISVNCMFNFLQRFWVQGIFWADMIGDAES